VAQRSAEAVKRIDRVDGLRLGRQVVSGIVLLGVLELGRERPERKERHEPNADDCKLRTRAARNLGERARIPVKSVSDKGLGFPCQWTSLRSARSRCSSFAT
jgi:hypothetical protein